MIAECETLVVVNLKPVRHVDVEPSTRHLQINATEHIIISCILVLQLYLAQK